VPVKFQIDQTKQLTVFTGTGEISYSEVRDAIDSFYAGTHTLNVLWDLRSANVSKITSEQVDQIANLLYQYNGIRKGVRTSLITPKDITFGLSRMLISLLEVKEKDLPINMHVFRTYEEAMNWLFKEE
jgi:hypothetical protein